MPRPSDRAKSAFQALLSADDMVVTRPMFGNLAAFVNGNMFAGLFGEDLFVRLPAEAREQVIGEGGAPFSPMPGRAMQEYVTMPGTWQRDHDGAKALIARSLAWTRELPAKQPKRRGTWAYCRLTQPILDPCRSMGRGGGSVPIRLPSTRLIARIRN